MEPARVIRFRRSGWRPNNNGTGRSLSLQFFRLEGRALCRPIILLRAAQYLRDAVERDPLYSAAWKALGRSLAQANRADEAIEAYRRGIEAARAKGDRQAEKEMSVFMKRLEKVVRGPGQDRQ